MKISELKSWLSKVEVDHGDIDVLCSVSVDTFEETYGFTQSQMNVRSIRRDEDALTSMVLVIGEEPGYGEPVDILKVDCGIPAEDM